MERLVSKTSASCHSVEIFSHFAGRTTTLGRQIADGFRFEAISGWSEAPKFLVHGLSLLPACFTPLGSEPAPFDHHCLPLSHAAEAKLGMGHGCAEGDEDARADHHAGDLGDQCRSRHRLAPQSVFSMIEGYAAPVLADVRRRTSSYPLTLGADSDARNHLPARGIPGSDAHRSSRRRS